MRRKERSNRPRTPKEPSELPITLRSYVLRSIFGLLPAVAIAGLMAFAPWEVTNADNNPVPVEYEAAPENTPPPPVEEPPLKPDDLTFGRGPLARDLADWVSPAALTHLNALCTLLEMRTSIQLGVLIVPNLGGMDIESFTLQAARKWKLGQKKKDNGILLLVARRERKLRIEVGRGLEGDLTDLQSHRIIDRDMVPLLKKGQVENALTAGVEAILKTVAPSLDFDHKDFSPPAPTPAPAKPAAVSHPSRNTTESYPGHGFFFLLFAVLFAYTGWKVVVLRQYRWLWALVAALGIAFAISPFFGTVLSFCSLTAMGVLAALIYGSSSGSSSGSSWSSSSSSSSGGGSSSGSSGSSGGGGSFGGGGASGQW